MVVLLLQSYGRGKALPIPPTLTQSIIRTWAGLVERCITSSVSISFSCNSSLSFRASLTTITIKSLKNPQWFGYYSFTELYLATLLCMAGGRWAWGSTALGDGRVEVRSVLSIVSNTTIYTWGGHVETLDDGRSHDWPDCRGQYCTAMYTWVTRDPWPWLYFNHLTFHSFTH